MSAVKLAPPAATAMGHRIGTAQAAQEKMFAVLGNPTHDWRALEDGEGMDGKVKLSWVFDTPRGRAEIRDYWWNKEGEWTIAAQSRKPAMWLARHLRALGFAASTRFYYLTDCKRFAP